VWFEKTAVLRPYPEISGTEGSQLMKKNAFDKDAGIRILLIFLCLLTGISIWPQPGRAGCSNGGTFSDHDAFHAESVRQGPDAAASTQPLFIAYSCNTWGRIKPVKA
jgi:hypothetical protein